MAGTELRLGAASLRAADLISALSYALDLTEGRPMGHAARSCVLGMRIAGEIGLGAADQRDLYYALLLKDSGCSSNASKMFHLMGADDIRSKQGLRMTDWTRIGLDSIRIALTEVGRALPLWKRLARIVDLAAHQQEATAVLVQIRCERGASVAKKIGFTTGTAEAIYGLDEQWNGRGYPAHLKGEMIPLLSRIMNLAQTLEAFHASSGPIAAMGIAEARSGKWFDPSLVRAAQRLMNKNQLWSALDSADPVSMAATFEPSGPDVVVSEERLDNICVAFGEVVDAKSPFTFEHSHRVAAVSELLALRRGLSPERTNFVRRAALLHDLGKLSVPNTILEKPGKLTDEEWRVMRLHPHYTHEILKRVPTFAELAEVAAAHHERLDGKGYHRGWGAAQLTVEARIIAVSDVFDALAATRPYRAAMPLDRVIGILQADAPHALDAETVAILAQSVEHDRLTGGLTRLADILGQPQAAQPTETPHQWPEGSMPTATPKR